jgi:hypothetical protein
VEDARTALEIYKKFQLPWERNVDKYLENFDKPIERPEFDDDDEWFESESDDGWHSGCS